MRNETAAPASKPPVQQREESQACRANMHMHCKDHSSCECHANCHQRCEKCGKACLTTYELAGENACAACYLASRHSGSSLGQGCECCGGPKGYRQIGTGDDRYLCISCHNAAGHRQAALV